MALGGVGALVAHVAVERPSHPAVVVMAASDSPDSPTPAHTADTSSVDVLALWQVMLDLDPQQSAVVVPALTPDVRTALAAIVHGIVYEGLDAGVTGA
jgi:hypothetical protein